MSRVMRNQVIHRATQVRKAEYAARVASQRARKLQGSDGKSDAQLLEEFLARGGKIEKLADAPEE